MKFSPPDGTITLAVRRRGRDAAFSVRDEGRGIPPEKLDAIFERFRQVDSSDRREKGGTGLGPGDHARDRPAQRRAHLGRERGRRGRHVRLHAAARGGDGEPSAVVERREAVRATLAARVRALGVRVVGGGERGGAVGRRAARRRSSSRPGPRRAAITAALDPELPAAARRRRAGGGARGRASPRSGPTACWWSRTSPTSRRLLASHLEHRGFQVELARTGREARDAIERSEPRLVVLDVALPARTASRSSTGCAAPAGRTACRCSSTPRSTSAPRSASDCSSATRSSWPRAVDAAGGARAPGHGGAGGMSAGRILVVDDEDDIRAWRRSASSESEAGRSCRRARPRRRSAAAEAAASTPSCST